MSPNLIQTRLSPEGIAHLLFLTPDQHEVLFGALLELIHVEENRDRDVNSLWEKIPIPPSEEEPPVKGILIPLTDGELNAFTDALEWYTSSLNLSLRNAKRERDRTTRREMTARYRRLLAVAETTLSKAKQLRRMSYGK